MHIAEIDIPEDIDFDPVYDGGVEHGAIKTASNKVPFGADCWIYCGIAPPHIDKSYAGLLFITLTVECGGDYLLCDSSMIEQYNNGDHDKWPDVHSGEVRPGEGLRPGTLSVVDPMDLHWLIERNNTPDPYWIGVQWEVKSEDAMETARSIVKKMNGRWLDVMDVRYRSWPMN